MSTDQKVYLAGPEVFLPNAREIGDEKKKICAQFGLIGLFPLDAELKAGSAKASPVEIYRANARLLVEANLLIANMTPFRGPSMDVGTAFEMGFMAARGNPLFGYTHVAASYMDRVRASGLAKGSSTKDKNGIAIEDFGLSDNLMMACAVSLRGKLVVFDDRGRAPEKSLADLTAFTECVRLAAHFVHSGRT